MKMSELSLVLSMLVTVLVLTQNASALQALGQIPINITLSAGESQQQTLVIYNDANETFTSTVILTGNISQVVTLLNDTISISPFSLGTIYYNVSVTSEGFWSGSIQVGTLNLPIYVYGKVFKVANWYQSGKDITIQPGDYRVSIQNVTQTSAYLLIFQHGYMIQGKSFSVGDEFSTPDIKIKVLDIFQDMVKIEIISKYLNTQVSVEGVGGTGGTFTN